MQRPPAKLVAHHPAQQAILTQEICSMLLLPVFLPVLRYSWAASTASPPMDTLSAPDLKYSEATSRADQCLPSASVNSRMPPPTVSGTNTPSLACLTTCPVHALSCQVPGQQTDQVPCNITTCANITPQLTRLTYPLMLACVQSQQSSLFHAGRLETC